MELDMVMEFMMNVITTPHNMKMVQVAESLLHIIFLGDVVVEILFMAPIIMEIHPMQFLKILKIWVNLYVALAIPATPPQATNTNRKLIIPVPIPACCSYVITTAVYVPPIVA